MKRKLICIACPVGCHLTAEAVEGGNIEVEGNRCPRGKAYAVNELTDPKRMVTGVVRCDSPAVPFLPVRTSEAITMKLIAPLLAELRKVEIHCPVAAGDVLIRDFRKSGVDVVASRAVGK
ncbi:MAG: DUF1667 domain-containing protein [Victivallaceae bacterium]|nr:DUF1667 domain-containing protein [Victivallaceae bacterium]